MKPTDEQVKEFWERFGLHPYPECECIRTKGNCWGTSAETYGKNGRWHFVLPIIDLNNLFKYAEFKAVTCIGMAQKTSIDDARRWLFERWLDNMEKGLNCTDALFWAIWEGNQ